MSKTLGVKLRVLRKRDGCTQQKTANLLSVNRSAYAYYEIGKIEPPIKMLLFLSRWYGVTFVSLCDDCLLYTSRCV